MNWAIVSITAHILWIAWIVAVIVSIHVIDGACIRLSHKPVLISGLSFTALWFFLLAVSTIAGPITRADIAVAIRIVEIVAVLLVWGWFWLMVKSMRRQIKLVATENRA
jgi:hypothetical protein